MIIEGIRLTNDYVFKKIFQNTQILSDFVSSVIGEKVSCLTIENSEILPEMVGNKLSRLDILAETETGEQINVEMQISYNIGFDDRMAYYGMRLHARNVKEGEKYEDIKRTIIIDILDFAHPLLTDRKEFCTDFKLRSPDGAVTLTNKFVVYFIEIPKLPEGALDNLTKLGRWLLFLRNEGGENVINTLRQEPMIAQAMTVAQALALDKREQMLAQYREDAIRDEIAGKLSARDEGFSLGRTEGFSLGEAKGLSLGKLETARNMLAEGLPVKIIKKVTGLSIDEIRRSSQ